MFRKKKFLLNEKTPNINPNVEISVLNGLLQSVLLEENYEMAEVIRSRIERIRLEQRSPDQLI